MLSHFDCNHSALTKLKSCDLVLGKYVYTKELHCEVWKKNRLSLMSFERKKKQVLNFFIYSRSDARPVTHSKLAAVSFNVTVM